MLAYSDGSAIADGVEWSAVAIVCVNGTDITAIVRLAAADKPLSSGRSEWTGLLLVLYVVRRVQAHVALRLDNLQVVNAFSDGLARYEHNWLRKNDRDMASLAWELSAERERRGLGTLTVLHQQGHPEERVTPAQYHTHDRYNARVDAATHRIKPGMPLYISFRRMSRQHTQLWYEPLEEGNDGHGTAHEVTGDSYRHIAKAAQRRASDLRVRHKDGDFQATFVRGVAGRAPSERCSALTSKLMHEHLATGARVAMWGGMERCSVACGCGHSLGRVDREDIGALQWHFLECELSPEKVIRQRWRAAVRTALTAATNHLVVVEAIVACWSSRVDGVIHTAAADQSNGWKPPTVTAVTADGGYAFASSGAQPTFDPTTYWGHETDSEGSKDEGSVTDAQHIVTANGTFAYDAHWNNTERAARPTVAAARLLHLARQRTGASRWWTMCWPSDAVSMLGRACGLNTGRTCGLMRALRKLSARYLREL